MSIERIVAIGFIGFAALAVAPFVMWWTYRLLHERKRRALQVIAAECQAEYTDSAVQKLDQLGHFRLFRDMFKKPSGQRIRNVLTRRFDDCVVTVFDYKWKGCDTGEDIDSSEHRTVVQITSDRLQLPRFDIRPNGLYLKLTSNWRDKVEIDNHPEFARRLRFELAEEEPIRRMFHRGVLNVITSDPRKFQFEGADGVLIFYTNAKTVSFGSLLVALLGVNGEGRLAPTDVPGLFHIADALYVQLASGTEHDSMVPEIAEAVDGRPMCFE